MSDEFMEIDDELALDAECRCVPVSALREASRRKLARHLDMEGTLVVVCQDGQEQDVVNNFTGLAELAEMDYHSIRAIQHKESPTRAFLEQWNGHKATVGNLWRFLILMERFDVAKDCKNNTMNDCQLYLERQEVEKSAAKFDIVQDHTVSNSEMKVDETKFATIDDIKNNEKTMYDAFICYTTESERDRDFVRDMIKHLEVERGLKLFVPGRNDIPGAAEHTINAYLIEERCRRVVILMSKKFLKSSVCDFQVKFAHALAPGARSKKLIPIIREKGTVMPRILKFLAVCDFTKTDMLEWVWERLFTAIKAPLGPRTYFEEEDQYDPFTTSLKDITFPTVRRLDDEEERQLCQSRRRPAPASSGAAAAFQRPTGVVPPSVMSNQQSMVPSLAAEKLRYEAGRQPVEHSYYSRATGLENIRMTEVNSPGPVELSFPSTTITSASSSSRVTGNNTEHFV